ncbi:MAG: hypothetical protein AAF420_10820 [Pseudomonadota bacterium]
MSDDSAAGFAYLASQGLNLHGVLDCAGLPDPIVQSLSEDIDLSRFKRLIVMGNSGTGLWEALRGGLNQSDNPIDDHSRAVAANFCTEHLPGADNLVVFPTHFTVPLQRLGALLGWGEPSPLGVGISHNHGLWWAYRAVVLTSADLALTAVVNTPHACDSCIEKPCVANCPAQAVSFESSFDVDACFHFRANENSPCVDRCLARMACPVGGAHRYPQELIQYIYRFSMRTVRAYVSSQ